MDSTLPKSVAAFELFLKEKGLICQRREGPDPVFFGNRLLEYGNGNIGVRAVSDRGVWFVEVADVAGRSDEWYDPAILRDLLLGPGEDVLPLPDQTEFVETNWPAIVRHFGSAQREHTHTRLALLRKERAKRRFPGLHPQNGPT